MLRMLRRHHLYVLFLFHVAWHSLVTCRLPLRDVLLNALPPSASLCTHPVSTCLISFCYARLSLYWIGQSDCRIGLHITFHMRTSDFETHSSYVNNHRSNCSAMNIYEVIEA